ncbi:hypothetical protein [Agrococcus jenensis]|uniref:Uncharacterized protein n=1 Tax=Agrococcus jenensis TaxID=46353 RepID=A0A3N2AR03_9MICO|nr:hypothetical protein [Agrococcus jenensis]ROR65335.1 hypothetical protein EDD26_0701 [Agrococcus jenensis]
MFEPSNTSPTTPLAATDPSPDATHYPFRLLKDERVLASYPITSMRRPLGHLVSFLFVTDSRVVYAAEAKTLFSTSTAFRETNLGKVDGIEVKCSRGVSALGVAVAVAVALNVIGILALGGTLTSAVSSLLDENYSNIPAAGLGVATVALAIATSVIGVILVISVSRQSGALALIGARDSVQLAEYRDWLTTGAAVVIFLLLALLLPVALLVWLGARALGLFGAEQAFLYANSKNIDTIAYDAGAVILDAQARGTMAGS